MPLFIQDISIKGQLHEQTTITHLNHLSYVWFIENNNTYITITEVLCVIKINCNVPIMTTMVIISSYYYIRYNKHSSIQP